MKQLFLLALLSGGLAGVCQTAATTTSATTSTLAVKLPAIDKSPMDMAYYPVNYPVLKIQDKAAEPLAARVIYSRPQKEGRAIFGGLIEYGKVWRLGANEATEIELYRDVKIKDKKLAKGRYTLYAHPILIIQQHFISPKFHCYASFFSRRREADHISIFCFTNLQ